METLTQTPSTIRTSVFAAASMFSRKKSKSGNLCIGARTLSLILLLVFLAHAAYGEDGCSCASKIPVERDAVACCDCRCLWHRNNLTGDWLGRQSCLKDCGITIDASVTQFYQGVTTGGREQVFRYAGHGEYLFDFDFEKLGVRDGLLLRARAEHRFGGSVNVDSGAILPLSILSDLPTSATADLVLTEVLFTQFISDNIAISFGKMNTFPQGLTPFTAGRGDDTFMNMGAMFPTVALTSVPYSTLGAGLTIYMEEFPLLTFNVLNSNDTITQSGFDKLFEDGVSLLGTVSVPTPIGAKPGVQTFGFSWNNREQVRIGQDPRVILPQVPVQTVDEAWSLFWQGFQYVQTYGDPQKGWGLFGSAGISDNNPTFLRYSLSVGIGGYVPLPCRPNDRFGVAWFYNELSNELGPIVTVLANPQDESGVELFYNVEVTPYFHVTPDLQILNPALARGDTAILFALRAKIDF